MAKRVLGVQRKAVPLPSSRTLPLRRPKANPFKERDEVAHLQAVFGENLRASRKKAGLTMKQVAEQTGLTFQYVSKVEKGEKNVTLATMIVLALVVRREVADLLKLPR